MLAISRFLAQRQSLEWVIDPFFVFYFVLIYFFCQIMKAGTQFGSFCSKNTSLGFAIVTSPTCARAVGTCESATALISKHRKDGIYDMGELFLEMLEIFTRASDYAQRCH